MDLRPLENRTTIQNISGSWYIRIPPEFAEHMGIKKDDVNIGRIRTEKNKRKQSYCSIWKEE